MALARGSHQSALSHMEFLRDEMADMIDQGYWVILPYSNVLHLPHLRLSPLALVPQRDRRPRIIVDYTFWGINDDTVPLAHHQNPCNSEEHLNASCTRSDELIIGSAQPT